MGPHKPGYAARTVARVLRCCGPGAYRLAYASQRHGCVDRMHDRSRRLYTRLGADYDAQYDPDWPRKPKGMRWRTYNAIRDQLEAEAYGLNVDLVRLVEKLPDAVGGDGHLRRTQICAT